MMNREQPTAQKAVIYCRIAGATPSMLADLLEKQEAECREFANAHGLDVVAVFGEHMSSIVADRPIVREMVGFIRQQSRIHGEIAVLVKDVARLARDITVLGELREAIRKAGGAVRSIDTPTAEAFLLPDTISVIFAEGLRHD